jgi:hypothetical protein
MLQSGSIDDRIQKLINSFNTDGFIVNKDSDVVVHDNFIGMRATSKTAVIGTTGKKKKVYYIEGDAHTMGYLMGQLSEPDISRMCTEFNENIVPAFINWQIEDPVLRKIIGEIIDDIILLLSENIRQDMPQQLTDEMEGMLDGCKAVNPKTETTRSGLWILNVGIDAILSYIYHGVLPQKKLYAQPLKAEFFRVPIMCNGFSNFGADSTTQKKYHFMGRDFMFPTADVFQDTATMIIRKPSGGNATVSVAAPGMIGTIAGVNNYGIGVGVDMSPASNSCPSRPGINSLLLPRLSIEKGKSCNEAVNVMINTQRGVSWDYILADGAQDTACIVEAGTTSDNPNFLANVDDWVINALASVDPNFKDLLNNLSVPFQKGLMVRYGNYKYPEVYQTFNEALINAFKKLVPDYKYNYNPEDFGMRGFIDKTWTDKNCPGAYYFAPEREKMDSTVFVSNHYVIPEMRYYAMNWWTYIVSKDSLDDIQWRYDELNNELLTVLQKGYMTKDEARTTIDFLAPYGKFPTYYNAANKPLNQIQVHGSVSLLDLKELTIESHYGYYSDEWIALSLKNYL